MTETTKPKIIIVDENDKVITHKNRGSLKKRVFIVFLPYGLQIFVVKFFYLDVITQNLIIQENGVPLLLELLRRVKLMRKT